MPQDQVYTSHTKREIVDTSGLIMIRVNGSSYTSPHLQHDSNLVCGHNHL